MGIKLKKNIFRFLLVMFFTAGLTSCGLDTFYILKGPVTFLNQPTSSNLTPNNNYVEFVTNETENNSLPSDFKFTGTEIYYRIYSNETDANAFITQIDAVNDESHYGTAAEKLNSSYSLLRSSNGKDVPFVISKTGSNQTVRIRLTEYKVKGDTNPDTGLNALITVNGIDCGQPVRAETMHTFNFGRYDEDSNNALPTSSDSDYTGSEKADIYYVNLFAVAFGHDVTLKKYYSNVLYLGTIKISPNNYNNWD